MDEKTMNAVVFHGPQDVRLEMVPVPACSPEEIRVRIDACAVCGTDLKSYRFGNPRISPPMVMGHEFTGLVETVGEAVDGFAIGERVVMATSISCGRCTYCHKGWSNLCLDLQPMSFFYPGGMAKFITIPKRALRNEHVIKVPATVKAEHAALAEPISCAVSAVESCAIGKGDTVVVIGGGPLGILIACVARTFGAGKVILAGTNERRLRMAERFGFDLLVNPGSQDMLQIVREETDGMGADAVIVAAPAVEPQEQAIEMVRKRGTVCLFASLPVGDHLISLNSRTIHYGELRVTGTSDSTPSQVVGAVKLISEGSLPLDNIVTHRLELASILNAFELMQSGEALRVVLLP